MITRLRQVTCRRGVLKESDRYFRQMIDRSIAGNIQYQKLRPYQDFALLLQDIQHIIRKEHWE